MIYILNFYDFEVFCKNWLVVIINPIEKTVTKIWDDSEKLSNYFYSHEEEIWIGYNNRRYDQYIMKAILLGMDPKEVNDYIIIQNRGGWQYSSLFNQIKMINFDTMLRTDSGLKPLEAFMGNDIQETSVPFDIDRELTEEEKKQTEFYCTHDVEQTIEVFLNRKAEFDAAMGLVKIFDLPLTYMGKTGAQRVAKILGGKGKKFDDEFQFPMVPTMRLGKYRYVGDWYKKSKNQNYNEKQDVMVAGVPHRFKWGGAHGAIKQYYGEGVYILADVTAYYPSLQLRYKLGYRNMANPENFEKIHRENLRFKKLGDKTARLPYKIADNAISGQLKDPMSPLYDPRENNAICVNGQLLLVDLIDKLEDYIELIQSNTDGILFKMPSKYGHEKDNIKKWYNIIDDIVYEWEHRTGMKMEFTIYNKIFQKDVNNYLAVAPNGKIKTKGAYTKSLSPVDFDLPIVNKAMVDYMVKNIPIEKTIYGCDELKMFQKVFKLSGKYWRVWHNGKYYVEKCYRVFASKNKSDTYLGKMKGPNATIEQFGNSPDHCFIDNENINGKKINSNLDKQWYIDITKKRLRQYGVAI